MTLLHTVVQILILAMQNLATDDPANCLRLGRMFVSRHPQWLLSCTVQQTPQETSCCMLVSVLAEHRIEKVSSSVDRTVQVTSLASDLDVGLIQVSGDSCCATALGAQILADQWSEAELTDPNGLVADHEPAL